MFEQFFQRCRRVEIALAIFHVVESQQHLGGGDLMLREQFRPQAAQRDLSNRRRGLRFGEAGSAAFVQAELARAQSDRSR